MSKKRVHIVPRSAEDIARGCLLGFSGNSKQRKQRMRALRRLGLIVDMPRSVTVVNIPEHADVSIGWPFSAGTRRIKLQT